MAHVDYFVQQLTRGVDEFDDPQRFIKSEVRALPREELQLIYNRMLVECCDVSRPLQVQWPLKSRILVYNALYNSIESRGEERPLLSEQGYPTVTADRPVSSKFPFIIDHNFSTGNDLYADPPDADQGYPKSRARVCSEDCWVLMGRLPASQVGAEEIAVYATTVNPFNIDQDLVLQYYEEKVAFSYYVMEGNTTIAEEVWRSPATGELLGGLPVKPNPWMPWARVQGVCWLQEHFALYYKTEAEVQQLDDIGWQRWLEVVLSVAIAEYISREDNLGVPEA